MTPQDIITEARALYNDTEPTRYRHADAALLRFVNNALDIMVDVRPELFSKIGTHTCSAGAEQTVSFTRAVRILDVRRVVNGDAILPTDKAALDAFMPSWYNATAGAAVNWMPGISPTKFYVYPPAAITQSIEVQYVEAPAELALGDTIQVSENYRPALVNYVVGMAETVDDEHVNSNRAAQTKADFVALIKGA